MDEVITRIGKQTWIKGQLKLLPRAHEGGSIEDGFFGRALRACVSEARCRLTGSMHGGNRGMMST